MNKAYVFIFPLSILLAVCPPACHAAALGGNGPRPDVNTPDADGNSPASGDDAAGSDGNSPGSGDNAAGPDDNAPGLDGDAPAPDAGGTVPDLQPLPIADPTRSGEDSEIFRFALTVVFSLWLGRKVTQRRRS